MSIAAAHCDAVVGVRLDAEEMPAPSGQFDVHTVDQIVSVPDEPHLLRRVDEGPATTAKVGPRDSYQPGRHAVAQVDHDQPPHVALPAPRDQVVVSGVSGPAGTQLPPSAPQARLGQHRRASGRTARPPVRRFLRIAAEEHRKVNRPSFDLTVVDQPHPGWVRAVTAAACQRDGRTRARPEVRRGSRRTAPGRADSRGPPEGASEPPPPLPHQPVVETLVVAVVEALLLQLPLQVPVGLGHEDKARRACRTSAIRVGQYSRPVRGRPPHPRCERTRRS